MEIRQSAGISEIADRIRTAPRFSLKRRGPALIADGFQSLADEVGTAVDDADERRPYKIEFTPQDRDGLAGTSQIPHSS